MMSIHFGEFEFSLQIVADFGQSSDGQDPRFVDNAGRCAHKDRLDR